MGNEYALWLKEPITQRFFKELLAGKDNVLNSMLCLSTTGEELEKDYYYKQGFASGLESAYNLAKSMEEGNE